MHRRIGSRLAPLATTAAVVGLLLSACSPPEEDGPGCPNTFPPSGDRSAQATCGAGIEPPTPSFGKSIDALASYVAQSTCSPTAKPGVKAFRDLILKTYPCTGDYGITRACSSGGTSEHKEGRAWDWKLSYPHPAADAVIKWLLATDKYGHKYANARRVGLMYMIWNRRIWGAYRPDDGWRTYTGSNPHTDHVHFSFSWDGAKKLTSFWTAPPPPPAPTNQAPRGYLDHATCDGGIVGWAQDQDVPDKAINVHIYIDSEPGKTGGQTFIVLADKKRNDLCSAIGSCNHGFSMAVPASLKDATEHVVRAYGVDPKTKALTKLVNVRRFSCVPPDPPPAGSDAGTPGAGSDGGESFGEAGAASDAGEWPTVPPPSGPIDDDDVGGQMRGACSAAPGDATLAQSWLLLLALGIARRRRRRRPRAR